MIKQISEDSILEILKALSVSEDEYKSKRESLKDTLSVAIVNCMNGLLLYLKGDFTQSLNYFRDSEILLKTANVDVEVIFYNLILGYVNFCEKNNNLYMLHYNKAKNIAEKNHLEKFLMLLEDAIKMIKNGGLYIASVKNDPLLALVKIGQAVAAEKDIDKLMQTIAEEARDAVQADRCTVFLYDKNTDELWSKVALGLGSHELRFNASQGLAGHVFRTGEIINIKDAYSDARFNKEIDLKNSKAPYRSIKEVRNKRGRL